ncbi:PD-(D/E)XK nuclease family protein [Patescibacteria group bacterium]|nr:PD-(D/E)XK nuclease family protein [Patescibacteria group bacterium]
MGKTKRSDGDYFRQLVFYKILGDISHRFPFKIVNCELDFVEPMPSGKYKKEVFKITKDDTDKLKKQIREVWQGIFHLKFDCVGDDSKCKKCEYYDICRRK